MDERPRFVARRLAGETPTALCREFGISRKTGHKIFARERVLGMEALSDRPRTPGALREPAADAHREPDRRARREKPHWGARKLRERLSSGGSAATSAGRPGPPSTRCPTDVDRARSPGDTT